MRVEIFLKNGKKQTIDNVTSIRSTDELSELLIFDYDKSDEGTFTTCDQPSIGFDKSTVDMLKVFNI